MPTPSSFNPIRRKSSIPWADHCVICDLHLPRIWRTKRYHWFGGTINLALPAMLVLTCGGSTESRRNCQLIIGQALPLVCTRFLRPRMSREQYPKRPRDINRSRPRTRQIRDQEQSQITMQTPTIHVREQFMSALSPCPQSRTHHSFTSPRAGISNGRTLSADSPRSRIGHVSKLVTDRNSPRTATGKTLSAPTHSCFHLVVIAFPSSYPNHSFVCPHLIQPQFAKRSMNSRRFVHRSSRICFRPRKSSSSFGKSAHRTGPLLNC